MEKCSIVYMKNNGLVLWRSTSPLPKDTSKKLESHKVGRVIWVGFRGSPSEVFDGFQSPEGNSIYAMVYKMATSTI